MIIAELLKELRKHDPSLRVVIDSYEGGLADVEEVKPLVIVLDVNVSEDKIFGPHEQAYDEYDSYPNHTKVHAVYLPRKSDD